MRPPRVLLLYTTTGYQAEDFLKAARRLEIETLIGTDRCHVLEDPWADGAIPLRFEDPEAAVRSIIEADALEGGASGVMMIPIPEGGILHRVDGLEEAHGIDGVEEVTLTAKRKEILVPLPEGSGYLGFIFARGSSPERTEETLRKAHRALQFTITPGMVLD